METLIYLHSSIPPDSGTAQRLLYGLAKPHSLGRLGARAGLLRG